MGHIKAYGSVETGMGVGVAKGRFTVIHRRRETGPCGEGGGVGRGLDL